MAQKHPAPESTAATNIFVPSTRRIGTIFSRSARSAALASPPDATRVPGATAFGFFSFPAGSVWDDGAPCRRWLKGPSLPTSSQPRDQSSPMMPRIPKAHRQPRDGCAMIQARTGAAMIGPSVDPTATRLLGRPRSRGANQAWTCCSDSGVAGPSTAPSRIRANSRTAAPPPSRMGTGGLPTRRPWPAGSISWTLCPREIRRRRRRWQTGRRRHFFHHEVHVSAAGAIGMQRVVIAARPVGDLVAIGWIGIDTDNHLAPYGVAIAPGRVLSPRDAPRRSPGTGAWWTAWWAGCPT